MGYVDRGREPRLIIPGLSTLYEHVAILSYPLVRATAGAFLLPHGFPKLTGGTTRLAGFLARIEWEPALFWAWLVTLLETVGAVCIVLGLFTRPIAAMLVVEFAVIVQVHSARGFSASANGWEFPAFWGLIFLAILLRGGGPYSLDRKLGREF
jgi:putative oxidoreductase